MSLTVGYAVMALAALAQSPDAAAAEPVAAPAPAPVAATPVAQVQASAVPFSVSSAVAAYYQVRPASRIWFKQAPDQLAADLAAILRRAPLDGLASGPILAAEVEAAMAKAKSGTPADQLAADKMLSAAWALYVQALRKPAAGVEYADRVYPKTPSVEFVLLQAEHAPSLQQHLVSAVAVNPIYAQLRELAWTQMQASGAGAVDPRLAANLDRSRFLPASGRFIVVDAATARLWMYEDGRIADSMKVIVGRKDTPTPMIASTIYYTTFNPYWNVPVDVVKRVHVPKILKGGAVKYLKTAKFEVASDWTDDATVIPPDEVDWKAVAAGEKEVRIRQLPGGSNMMGHYKFSFANQSGIYLHDTPQKGLFARAKRNFSLGCVRVEDAKRLAAWLALGAEPVAPNAEPEQHVQLPKGVPIYITYLTAHAEEGGELSFADDIYGLDPAAPAPTQLAVAP